MITVTPSSTAPHLLPSKANEVNYVVAVQEKTMEGLLGEVQSAFGRRSGVHDLLRLSTDLQAEFKEHLIASPQCMLPSHNYLLPTGKEHGTYLALEVGGSTLRVALVDLEGRGGAHSLDIRRIENYPVSMAVRMLGGLDFFDWIAARIKDMLAVDKSSQNHRPNPEPLHMGIAWSFPVDQTSIRSGKILGMGKGFHCSKAVTGLDLGDLMTDACQRAGLNVCLDAIVNDSSAALLSRAYVDSSTRLALILGTGINAAIHLPIASLHDSKFGERSMPEDDNVSHVLVNTELSMFGKKAFPTTRWDETVNNNHLMPNYQPMEYLIAGGYMGELVRLIILEATETVGLFAGKAPTSLSTHYTLDARTLAAIEVDTSATLSASRKLFHETHPTATFPSISDMYFIQQVIRSVSRRSCAYATAAIHALASLLQDMEKTYQVIPSSTGYINIGCDGSIINKYPHYMDTAQALLDQMNDIEPDLRKKILLEKTFEPAVSGAGVAVAMAALHP